MENMKFDRETLETLSNSSLMRDFIEKVGEDIYTCYKEGKEYNLLNYYQQTTIPLEKLYLLAFRMKVQSAIKAIKLVGGDNYSLQSTRPIDPKYFAREKFSYCGKNFTMEDALRVETYMKKNGIRMCVGTVKPLVMDVLTKNGKLRELHPNFIEDRVMEEVTCKEKEENVKVKVLV